MLLAAFVCFLGLGSVVSAQSYVALFPKELRPNTLFRYNVMLMSDPRSGSTMTIALRETEAENSQLLWDDSIQTVQLTPGKTYYEGSFMVASDLYSSANHYAFISWSDTKINSSKKMLTVNRVETPMIILTDKPIYKPGELILFNVLLFGTDLKPRTSSYMVEVQDPDQNTIVHVRKDPDDDDYHPYYEGSQQLSQFPVMGEYIISATDLATNEYTEVKVLVDEYKLPKFEVTFDLDPPFAVSYNGAAVRATGNVNAKYTYGKDVKGSLKLYEGKTEVEDIKYFTGSYNFDVELRYRVDGSTTVKLMAILTEQHTLIEANATAHFNIYDAYFEAKVAKPIPYYSKSESRSNYTFKVDLNNAMGGPLAQFAGAESVKLSNYRLRYTVNNQDGPYQEVFVNENPVEVTIPSDQKVDFNQNIKVWFVFTASDGTTYEGRTDSFTPVLYESFSNEILRIQLEDSQNKDEVCFSVSPCQPGDLIAYQVINNFYHEKLKPYTCTIANQPTCFQTELRHAPKSMIMAIKKAPIKGSFEVLAASVKFDKDFTTKQQVDVNLTPTVQKPGGNVEFQITTTGGQSMVGLISTDVSLDLIAEPNDLDEPGLEHSITASRPFENDRRNPYENGPIPLFRGGPPIMEGAVERKKRSARNKRSLCWGCGGYVRNVDAGQIIKDAGLVVATDLSIKTSSIGGGGGEWGDRVFEAAPVADGAEALPKQDDADQSSTGTTDVIEEEEPTRTRKNFVEQWLWKLVKTDSNGVYTTSEMVPDTITSWNVKCFAFNAVDGLGVCPATQLTVFQDFFVSMNLPYSIKRGEKFTLQILVFNYMNTEVEVGVVLKANNAFRVEPIDQRMSDPKLLSQKLTVARGSSAVAYVPIRAVQVTDLLLHVTATGEKGSNAQDIVERSLKVEAEGIQYRYSYELPAVPLPVVVADRLKSINMSRLVRIDRQYIVANSFRMKLGVTGDVMGPFISDIGSVPQIPMGCGEQNIKLLAPSVLVATYLKAVGRYSGEIVKKCEKYAAIGYTRELTYKHTTEANLGGYSAWGNSDQYASTWLTCYVLRMFALLAGQELTYVDRKPLNQAFEFLERRSLNATVESYFEELARPIHHEMQGGTSAGIGLTSTCVLSLLELRNVADMDGNLPLKQKIDAVLVGAFDWLDQKEGYLVDSQDGNIAYQQAIAASAYAGYSKYSGDPHYQTAEKLLTNFEEDKDSLKLPKLECPSWGRRAVCKDRILSECPDKCPNGMLCCQSHCTRRCQTVYPRRPTGPTKTEMTGYAMMAYTKLAKLVHNDDSKVNEYNKFKGMVNDHTKVLLEGRGANGNFQGTQDTVIALEALARRGIQFVETKQSDFKVRAMVAGTVVSDWINVDTDNYIITQEVDLDISSTTVPSDVKLEYEGTQGSAIATVEAIYNVQEEPRKKVFDAKINTYLNKLTKEKSISVCLKNADDNRQMSSMVAAKLTVGSGLETLGVVQNSASNIEIDSKSSSVALYFDVVDSNFVDEHCTKLIVEEAFEVQDRTKGILHAFDYYDPVYSQEFTFATEFTEEDPDTTSTAAGQIELNIAVLLVATILPLLAAMFRQ